MGALSSGTLQRYEPAPFESPLLVNNTALAFSPDGRQMLLMWNPVDGEQAWLLPYPPDPARQPQRVLQDLPAFGGTPTLLVDAGQPPHHRVDKETAQIDEPLYREHGVRRISVA